MGENIKLSSNLKTLWFDHLYYSVRFMMHMFHKFADCHFVSACLA